MKHFELILSSTTSTSARRYKAKDEFSSNLHSPKITYLVAALIRCSISNDCPKLLSTDQHRFFLLFFILQQVWFNIPQKFWTKFFDSWSDGFVISNYDKALKSNFSVNSAWGYVAGSGFVSFLLKWNNSLMVEAVVATAESKFNEKTWISKNFYHIYFKCVKPYH